MSALEGRQTYMLFNNHRNPSDTIVASVITNIGCRFITDTTLNFENVNDRVFEEHQALCVLFTNHRTPNYIVVISELTNIGSRLITDITVNL